MIDTGATPQQAQDIADADRRQNVYEMFKNYLVPAGQYHKTEDDKDTDRWLEEHGHTAAEINDPYGIRGGKPMPDEPQPSTVRSSTQPRGFDEEPGTMNLEPKTEAPWEVRVPPGPGQEAASRAAETPDVEAPVDLSTRVGRSPLADVPPPAGPERDRELEHAMGQMDLRNKIANAFRIFGIEPQGIDQPLQQLAEQRQLQREHFQDQQLAEANDPTSRPSRMAQAVAIKRFGWSPEDAKYLTASDMKMVNEGFNAEEVRKAREEATLARKQTAQGEQSVQYQKAKWEHEDRLAKATGGAQGKPPDIKATSLLEGLDMLDQQLDAMPTGYNPAEMYQWAKGTNDMMAMAVGAGRLNRLLMQNVQSILPGVSNMIPGVDQLAGGSREQLRDRLKSLVQRERSGVLRVQQATGHNTQELERIYPNAANQAAQPSSESPMAPELENATGRTHAVTAEGRPGGRPMSTTTPVREPGGAPVSVPTASGEPRVNVIMANGRPASLPASQVDAARKAGAIR
jgi:hypothetical protein